MQVQLDVTGGKTEVQVMWKRWCDSCGVAVYIKIALFCGAVGVKGSSRLDRPAAACPIGGPMMLTGQAAVNGCERVG